MNYTDTKAQADSGYVEPDYDAYYGSPAPPLSLHKSPTSGVIEDQSPLRKDAPQSYVVKKGDTLWGISRMFLKNPYYWPEIWDKNQEVRNPHKIYPGDKLYIYQTSTGVVSKGNTIKLQPTIRIERNGKGKPISTFEPFLAWPRIVSKDDLTSAPYIVAAKDAKMLMEKDKTVYIKGLSHSARGDSYAIYHTIGEIHDPDTQELLGTRINYHGKTSVINPDDITSAIVEESSREIKKGDRLIKVNPKPLELDIPMSSPTTKIRGSIMDLYDAKMISGQRMVALINRGARDGVRPGHIIGIYSQPRFSDDPYDTRLGSLHEKKSVKVKLPPERIGTMVIYNVSDRLSYGLITESDTAIKIGHKLGNP